MRQARFFVVARVVVAVLPITYFVLCDLLSPPLDVVHLRRGEAIETVHATGTVESFVELPIGARTTARLADDYDLSSPVPTQSTGIRVELEPMRLAWLASRGYARRDIGQQYLGVPLDQTIVQRDEEVGQPISANKPPFRIASGPRLMLRAEVEEKDISKIHVDQQVVLRAPAIPGHILYGQVQSITSIGDPAARRHRVFVLLPNDAPLFIGMSAEVDILVRRDSRAFLVPASALRGTDVWLVVKGRLRMVSVQIGAKDAHSVEITVGLSENDVILRDPPDGLTDGDHVRTHLVGQ